MDEELKQDTTKNTATDNNADKNENIHVMYCGPNIPSKGIFAYQVYIGGLPYNVREMTEKIPEIKKLICPVRDADAMRAKIARKGSAESIYYERVKGKVIK